MTHEIEQTLLDAATTAINAAKQAGATEADAIGLHNTDLTASVREGKLQSLEQATSKAIGLRVMVGKKSATISSSDLAAHTLKDLAEQAVSMARNSTDDPYAAMHQQPQPISNASLQLAGDITTDSALLVEQAHICEAAAIGNEGITNTQGAESSSTASSLALATSHGFTGSYSTTSHALSVSVLAGKDLGMQRDYAYSVARHASDLKDASAIGNEAAERTLKRLNPRHLKSQSAPVLFDPRIARSLLGYFISAINGRAIARGTSFLKNEMSKNVFSGAITIMDDPLMPKGLASHPFDGEGTAGKPRALIEQGTLKSWLLDLSTAKQLELETTGHASRGLTSPPSPSASNAYVEAGKDSPEALIKQMGTGLLVTECFGMGVNLVTGDYSQGASGFWIENGEISHPVHEFTIAGHLKEMFASMIPANDLVFESRLNAPHLLVERMMIAGTGA